MADRETERVRLIIRIVKSKANKARRLMLLYKQRYGALPEGPYIWERW